MSLSEISRLEVVDRIAAKRITQGKGADQLGISRRQMVRICHRHKQEGAVGLVSKRRGKPSNNHLSDEVRKSEDND